MNRPTWIAVSCIAVMVLCAAAIKMIWFPAVKDAWFLSNQRGLRMAPADLTYVRPSQFPNAPTNSITYANVNGKTRVAGRNVNFQNLFAIAYQYNRGLIHLPDDAPRGNFDFIFSNLEDGEARMRQTVDRATGFSAQEEVQQTDVLALKVADPYTTNLIVSGPDEKPNSNFKKGRLYFTHTQLSHIANGLGLLLEMPVKDETGLTNYYDFSIAWTRNLRTSQLSRDDVDKIVAQLGLRFEPDTDAIKMLVVKKGS